MTLGDRDAQVSARLIAIAVAELVLTSWMELTLPRASAAPPADGAPAAQELRRAAQAPSATSHAPPEPAMCSPWARRSALSTAWVSHGEAACASDGRPAAHASTMASGTAARLNLELTAARNETRRGLGAVEVSIWSAALRVSLRRARGRAWFDMGAAGGRGSARGDAG